MNDQLDKSPEFIQQKYIQLLEKSNIDLHNKYRLFPKKNTFILFGIIAVVILIATTFFINQSQTDIFKDHLLATSYNNNHIFLETKQGIFYQISKNTDKKWLADSGVFVTVNDQQISFTATNSIPEKWRTTYKLWIPKDKQYTLINADGTKVQLNSNSQFTFTNTRITKFPNGILIGEALFDVAHNPKQPYTIKASKMNIEVFGTEFNISNYQENNSTQLALIKGSVKVSSSKNGNHFIKPGQQATVFRDNETLVINDADFSKTLAWRSDQFYFNTQNLEEITKKVTIWYNVKFLFKDTSIKKLHFTGSLKKENGLIHFLEMLQYTEGINYKINNKEIILSKGNNSIN